MQLEYVYNYVMNRMTGYGGTKIHSALNQLHMCEKQNAYNLCICLHAIILHELHMPRKRF